MSRFRARRTAGTSGRILLAGLVAASGVGVAQAYYLASGTGAGTAATDTAATVSLSPASVTDTLYPADTATVSLTASNPNNAEVRIGSLVVDTTQGTNGFARASGSASCGLTTFTFATQNNAGDGWTVPPNGSLAIMLPDAVAASASTVSACQNVTLTIYLKASG